MAFKDLPSWAKGTVAVVGTLAIVGGGFFAIRGIKRYIENKQSRDSEKATSGDLKDLNKNQSTAQTFSNSQAQTFASALFSAMDGWGTDEEAIFSVFKNCKNDADVLAIIKAFGQRANTAEILWTFDTMKGDLSALLRDELDSSDISKINTIFASKNIKFRF